ncbi:unnamed protein product [Porites lobata]|uniref:Uncharacterized protein n=1 Tax=Porites lobata TaxID=104759 RepID=A0ABN8RKD3_9CNID|nr:unnamed protein product [Porites lobata]
MAYNRIKQIFEALEARDAVLLNEIIESMNGSERASVLFRRERSDDKDCVCCSQATDRWVSRKLRPIKRYVSSAFPDSKSPLVTAVKNGDLDSVKVLFKHHLHIGVPFREGLLLSAVNGNTDILRYFIEKKGDIDARIKNHRTLLMAASMYGHTNAVNVLLQDGANVALTDKRLGCTALHFAAGSSDNSGEILRCLIENGADVNGVNKVKHTPLMIAAIRGHINALTLLIKHGANVDLQDSDGYKALHFAVHGSDISSEIFSCLIGIGADVNARTNNGVTPLMIAAEEGHINAVTSLVKCGANVDLQDKYGNTALHYAAGLSVDERFSDDLPEIVEMLLNLGASHMCNHQGLKPLHQASISGNIAVVEYLIQRPEITREQRVDALELLGASLATQFSHISLLDFLVWEGLMYIKLGMEERFVDPSQPILKQPKEPAYGNRKESQTPEELAQIEGDTEAILMESLLIKERILGTNHSELLPSIRFVCRQGNLTDPSLLIALYRRAVDIAQKSNLSALDDFQEISHLLHKICNGSNHLKEKDLLELLRQIVIEYEKQHTKRRRLNK